MVQCGDCLVWMHVSCCRLEKSDLPDFICHVCLNGQSRPDWRVSKHDFESTQPTTLQDDDSMDVPQPDTVMNF